MTDQSLPLESLEVFQGAPPLPDDPLQNLFRGRPFFALEAVVLLSTDKVANTAARD
ncbi:MAG: hypothetical protein M3348_17465 [Acidobacteriota bacterium]|nr:hypothetical protein [Acidobacteriota bacterium]